MLQCVAVCCNVLQCVAVCCSVLQCVAVCCNVLQCVAVRCFVGSYRSSARPLKEKMTEICVSPDLPDFRADLLSDGDSVYSHENLFKIWVTSVRTCLICTGTPVKTC